jgi:raffinose/stachyose/melibiose transport system permease protein
VGASRYGRRTLARELALIFVAAIFCLPFYVLVSISLETDVQTYRDPLALPRPVHFGNYSEAWRTGGDRGLVHSFQSSLIITLSSVTALIVLGSLCAYTIARRAGALGNTLYVLFVLGIILPFQLAIIPLFVAMRHVGLVGNYAGMIVLNIGLLMPLTVFLYTGFIRALPRDYEEAARVDGASILRTYARVVIPLLWPITATVALLAGIVVWNEFFVALVFLGTNSTKQTLPVAVYSFWSAAGERWNLMLAGVVLAITPVLVFYLFAQRHLIRGFSAGVTG